MNKPHVLFLNPPFLKRYSRESRSPAVAKSGTLYYPMWLCYAAAVCEKAGFEIDVIDAAPLNIPAQKIIEFRIKQEPDLLVVNTSTPSIYNDIKVAEEFALAFPAVKIILVGPHVTAVPIETLKLSSRIDACAEGSYDFIVRDYAIALRDNKDLRTIKGLVWRQGKEIIRNEEADTIENMDSIQFVSSIYKRFLDIEDYFYGHSMHPLMVITTGRGCNFKCSYCVLPQTMHKGRYRFRSVNNVIEEFKYIYKEFSNIKEIMIEDDTLTMNKDHVREFCQKLIENNLNIIPWSANSRADVDLETLKLMKQAGCRLLCVGFESGNQTVLNNIRKGIKIEMFTAFVKNAKQAGVMIHGCFMVGNWGETKETMKETLKLALTVNPDTAQFYPIMIYPGTFDFERHEKAGNIVTKDYRKWLDEEGLHSSVVSIPGLTFRELVDFCDYARRRFYLRPKYIFYKFIQGIKNPYEFKRNIIGAWHLFKYIFKRNKK